MGVLLGYTEKPNGQLLPVSGAVFSPCQTWRYQLWRRWLFEDHTPTIGWVMLNPSRADESKSDNTVTRCINFSKGWGFGAMFVFNLFAFRSPFPEELKAAADPVGPENDETLRSLATQCDRLVVAWGNDGAYQGRARHVVTTILNRTPLYCLGTNEGNWPTHPLYVPANRGLQLYRFGD